MKVEINGSLLTIYYHDRERGHYELYQNDAEIGCAVSIVCGQSYLDNNTFSTKSGEHGGGVSIRYKTQFTRNRLYNGYFDCMNKFIFNNIIAENISASVGGIRTIHYEHCDDINMTTSKFESTYAGAAISSLISDSPDKSTTYWADIDFDCNLVVIGSAVWINSYNYSTLLFSSSARKIDINSSVIKETFYLDYKTYYRSIDKLYMTFIWSQEFDYGDVFAWNLFDGDILLSTERDYDPMMIVIYLKLTVIMMIVQIIFAQLCIYDHEWWNININGRR